MIRFLLLAILILLIARMFWRVVDGILEAAGGTTKSRRRASGPAPVKLVRDPVCGTWVAPDGSVALDRGGTTHRFCSEQCREAFLRTAARG